MSRYRQESIVSAVAIQVKTLLPLATNEPQPRARTGCQLERDAGLCYRGGMQKASFQRMQEARRWLRNREFGLERQHDPAPRRHGFAGGGPEITGRC